MEPPWSILVEDRAPVSVVAVTRGEAWIVRSGDGPRHLEAGSVAVVRGPDPYVFADRPDTPVQVVIGPGQTCHTVEGQPMEEAMDLGLRTWGNDLDGSTCLLVGTYEHTGAVGERLLAVLPPTIVLPAEAGDGNLLQLLGAELVKDEPGQETVLDRLLDLVLVSAIRTWLATDDGERTAWYRAHGDPIVGPALRLLHNNVAHPWTVAGLAAEVGVSRALLARRFTELVGRPPMAYLTDARLDLAADRLLEPGTTISAVAREVGYGSAFALSAAFKRVRGLSPSDHRTGTRASAA
jgi:AraC-like DNA-binding protein